MWQADFEEEDDVDIFKHHGVERFLFPLRHLHAGQLGYGDAALKHNYITRAQ